jgi:hypothetical protein
MSREAIVPVAISEKCRMDCAVLLSASRREVWTHDCPTALEKAAPEITTEVLTLGENGCRDNHEE